MLSDGKAGPISDVQHEGFQRLLENENVNKVLIHMDIQLPGIDRLTLTRILKSNPSLRDIIIAGVTAYDMQEEVDNVRAAGCDGYLSNPIDTRALPDIIASCLHPAVGQ